MKWQLLKASLDLLETVEVVAAALAVLLLAVVVVADKPRGVLLGRI
jgi:hypothetical protein